MFKIKSFLTLLYSAVIAGFLYYALYLFSLRIKMKFSESLFLIALVIVIIGIVVSIAKNPRFINCGGMRQKNASVEEDDESDEPKILAKSLLIGFNSVTIILTGVLLLVVDAIIK